MASCISVNGIGGMLEFILKQSLAEINIIKSDLHQMSINIFMELSEYIGYDFYSIQWLRFHLWLLVYLTYMYKID